MALPELWMRPCPCLALGPANPVLFGGCLSSQAQGLWQHLAMLAVADPAHCAWPGPARLAGVAEQAGQRGRPHTTQPIARSPNAGTSPRGPLLTSSLAAQGHSMVSWALGRCCSKPSSRAKGSCWESRTSGTMASTLCRESGPQTVLVQAEDSCAGVPEIYLPIYLILAPPSLLSHLAWTSYGGYGLFSPSETNHATIHASYQPALLSA